jgi:Rod binding domain-containing protein
MSDMKIGSSKFHTETAATQGLLESRGDNKFTKAGYAEKAKIEKAAKEFEGVFMDIVVKSMRETVIDSDVAGDSEKVKFFQSMLDTEYANISSKKSKLGLADAMIRQMTPKSQQDMEQKIREAKLQGQTMGVNSMTGALPGGLK